MSEKICKRLDKYADQAEVQYGVKFACLFESFEQEGKTHMKRNYGDQTNNNSAKEYWELHMQLLRMTTSRMLYFYTNEMQGIPLKELPTSIGQLINLQELYLYGNQLKEVPESIVQLSNLKKLNLNNNHSNINILRYIICKGRKSIIEGYHKRAFNMCSACNMAVFWKNLL